MEWRKNANNVLRYMADNMGIPHKPEAVCKKINANIGKHESLLLFHMIKNDGYIAKLNENSDAFIAYEILYKGLIFIEDGGYVQQKINQDASNLEVRSRNRRMERNENLLWVGTGCLVIVEIVTRWDDFVKFLCHFCSC